MRNAPTEERALCGIKSPVSHVPHIDLPQHWIGFAHALQNCDSTKPKRDCQSNSPQCGQAEGQSHGDQKRH